LSTNLTYEFIASVLALGHSPSEGDGREVAIKKILSGKINWKQLVNTASNHLVLQTMYVRFRQNELLGILPSDLLSHLKYIYDLNLERNKKMLMQAGLINDLLKEGGITPIFMKGMGNLVDGLYRDPGERIMCDIDLLTGPGQMENAAGILLARGYLARSEHDPGNTEAMKHFPVLYKEGEPGLVDIHRLPVNIQYSGLFKFETADRHKRPASDNPSFMVMSDAHKIRLSFIHSQLVHWGHHSALPLLRELYDLHLLSEREDPALVLSEPAPFRGKAAGYLRVMNRTFGVRNDLGPPLRGKGRLYLLRHRIILCSPVTGNIIYKILRSWRLWVDIPLKSLLDPNYRVYLKARLKDPGWYRRNLLPGKIFGNRN
jgi:hypothetical protein